MALEVGTRLGPYEITGILGKGGMGEVHRARDPRLRRDVAIKTSAQQFTERFTREARAIAALNHPNICQIYDVGPNYLVMELVEGESPQGPMELDDALRLGTQIAAALQAAHEKQITHRDLKPGNIKITPQGQVKILDFGLAKFGVDGPHVADDDSPTTLSMSATQEGVILGTAAYMAPEQARGKPVDARADIWAFGVVLYELITGQLLFKGEDLTETRASVVKDKPDLSVVPRRVRRLLEACLEKDPSRRLQSIGDMRLLLDDNDSAPTPADTTRKTSRFPWILAAAAAVLAAVALWSPWRAAPETPDVVRFAIEAPPRTSFSNWMSLAPDGKKVAFTARTEDGQTHLWVRPIDKLEATPIANTGGDPVPFWSADSRWIAYQLDGKLRKVETSGGPSQVLSDAPPAFGSGSFSPDGTIILFGGQSDVLRKVSSNGGKAVTITTLDPARQETGHFMPVFLHDGKHFLYQRRSLNPDYSGTFVGSLDDKPDAPASTRLIGETLNAVYTSGGDGFGQILFRREQALLSQPFDETKLTLTGEPVLVEDPVGSMNNVFLNAAVSPRTLIVREAGLADLRQLTWMGAEGKASSPVTGPGSWLGVNLSRDALKAAASMRDDQGNFDIFTVDLASRQQTRLTFDSARDVNPIWSPDRSRIAFTSQREGALNLFWKPSDGATPEEAIFKSADNKVASDWSRDGKYLLFTSRNGKTKGDLWTLSMTGPERKATLYLGSDADETQGRFSPDGRFVVYQSDESGAPEIYIRTFPNGGGKWQVSKGGGTLPRWSSEGKQVAYISSANVMSVKVTTSPSLQVADPVKLFTGYDGGTYDVAPDGRFLVAVASGQNSVSPITVILNWQTLLKK